MGRKIPGRKHRGIRDPEKQRQERLAKIKDKINAPPTNTNDQEIPKSLAKIIELKNKVKTGLFNKKKKQHQDKTKGYENDYKQNDKKLFKEKPEKPIPKFVQRPGESIRHFKHRMSSLCSDVIRETAFEEKYKINIQRNQTGRVEKIVKQPKDELEILVKKANKEEKLKKKGIKLKKKKENLDEKTKLTKSQKWARKKAEKKNKKFNLVHEDSTEVRRENVRFGDIVHAPPSLVIPRKATKEGTFTTARPGKKDLILKSMLHNKQTSTQAVQNRNKDISTKLVGPSKDDNVINKKGKRKDLPVSLRRQLDNQQKEVIEAYKLLKSKKFTNSSLP